MKRMWKQLALVASITGLAATSAQAALLTSNTIASPTVVDFSTQATVVGVPGPIQVGTPVGLDIQANGSPNTGLYTNYDGWSLGSNGNWGNGMTYISANDARPGPLTFHFISGPVAEVGAFMNYYPDDASDLIIRVYDASSNLLEEYNITTDADIVTPGGSNAGGFRGISRATADISYFEIDGYVPVVDDLTFSPVATTPTPTSIPTLSEWGMIILSCLLTLGAIVTLRRQRQ
jgi:hypothetical protein